MKVSTKGRYALRVVVDLAEHFDSDCLVPLQEIAKRQDISLKYLENIMSLLSKVNLVESKSGKNGGYKLKVSPAEISVYTVLSATEGSLAPVACLSGEVNTCSRKSHCKTLSMWQELDSLIKEFYISKTIDDFLK